MHFNTLRPRTHQRRFAFSLLELLIVIVCVAILALIVVPTVSSVQATQLRTAARLLMADLEYAQMESIGHGADPCAVVFAADGSSYFIARESAPDTPVTDPGTHRPYVTTFGQGRAAPLEGVTLESVEVGGDGRVGYTALGALDQGADAVMTLKHGSATLQVRVDSATGLPALE